jgi:hypothetical protein
VPRRVRTRPQKIGIILVATAVALVMLEVMLATVPPMLMPPSFRTIQTFYRRRADWRRLTAGDDYVGFKLRPDVEVQFPFEGGAIPIRTSSYGVGPIGFRDIGTRPPFGAIVVGDSFTFCDEVRAEACWVRRLADASGVSMATLGVSGYSTLAEARVLKRYGPKFGAPLVMLGIFPNDLTDNVAFDKWARSGSDDMAAWLDQRRRPRAVLRWLEEHSTMYRVLAAFRRARKRSIHRVREGNLDVVLRFDNWWLASVKAPERHPGWPLMQDGLLDMRQTAADMRARLVVVIFPTKEEAYWDIAQRYLSSSDEIDVNRLPRLIDRFLAEHDMIGCDVTGEIREQARRGRQLYHRVSGHFNEEGNSVAAEAVGRCLAAHHLLGTGQRAAAEPASSGPSR